MASVLGRARTEDSAGSVWVVRPGEGFHQGSWGVQQGRGHTVGKSVTYGRIKEISKYVEDDGSQASHFCRRKLQIRKRDGENKPRGLDWNGRYWDELLIFHVNRQRNRNPRMYMCACMFPLKFCWASLEAMIHWQQQLDPLPRSWFLKATHHQQEPRLLEEMAESITRPGKALDEPGISIPEPGSKEVLQEWQGHVKRILLPAERGFHYPNLGQIVWFIWESKENAFGCWRFIFVLCCGCVRYSWYPYQPSRRHILLMRPKCATKLAQIHHHKWTHSSNLCPLDNMVACLKYVRCGCLPIRNMDKLC